jgi:lysophospholipase L1-like esterase
VDRRKALALLGIGALAGCGGGGSAVAASSASPSGSAATTAGRSIACWGDSITALYAPHLQAMFPNRQVYNGGVVGQTSAQINARVQADTSHRDWIGIFWYGHNDGTKDQVAANLAASIATLAPGTPFIVVAMLNWSTDLPGSANYDSVVQVDAQLARAYPDNFVDMREWLVSRYNPALAQDVADHANDETPSSLRFDTIHPNDAGCDVIAAKLRDFISAKGW